MADAVRPGRSKRRDRKTSHGLYRDRAAGRIKRCQLGRIRDGSVKERVSAIVDCHDVGHCAADRTSQRECRVLAARDVDLENRIGRAAIQSPEISAAVEVRRERAVPHSHITHRGRWHAKVDERSVGVNLNEMIQDRPGSPNGVQQTVLLIESHRIVRLVRRSDRRVRSGGGVKQIELPAEHLVETGRTFKRVRDGDCRNGII